MDIDNTEDWEAIDYDVAIDKLNQLENLLLKPFINSFVCKDEINMLMVSVGLSNDYPVAVKFECQSTLCGCNNVGIKGNPERADIWT